MNKTAAETWSGARRWGWISLAIGLIEAGLAAVGHYGALWLLAAAFVVMGLVLVVAGTVQSRGRP